MTGVFAVASPEEADPRLAAEIGRLLPGLDRSHMGQPVDIEWLGDLIASPTSALFTARSDGELVGMATVTTLLRAVGEIAWLDNMIVAPEVRRQGVAQALWDAVAEWRWERDLAEMWFSVRPHRAAARRFYIKNGCVEIATGETSLFAHRLDTQANTRWQLTRP